ncbi:MAG TPA: hypothetical protein VGN34_23900 [Ktedonobacteraceae bacterium]|jgi:hypothetical protein
MAKLSTEIDLPEKPPVLVMTHALSSVWMIHTCMHVMVVRSSETLLFCNNYTDEDCVGCGRPTCEHHFFEQTMSIQDHEGYSTSRLCATCATLPRTDIEAMRTLRLTMNTQ